MKEIPILFSTPMVQAILEGRKTMTRRTTDLDVINKMPSGWRIVNIFSETNRNIFRFESIKAGYIADRTCRYGQPGDVLWVREKHAKTMGHFEPETTYSYFADSFHWSFFPDKHSYGETSCQWHDPDLAKEVKWKPSIHMPKASARIWLQVEEIRVERLLDITEEDAIAEGVQKVGDRFKNYYQPGKAVKQAVGFLQAKTAFNSLWNEVNGEESWDDNPWVWVVKFKVLSTTGKPELTADCFMPLNDEDQEQNLKL